MISHLLDTNSVISLIGQRSDAPVNRVLQAAEGTIGLPSIVAHELYLGAQKSMKVQHNLEPMRLLLAD